ncbi:MAG: type II toxin-antitoxin system RelE/ParE family toxin [Bacteroidia bacterium]
MAEKRKVVLKALAEAQVSEIYDYLLSEGENGYAETFINDFLDVVFDEIPRFPEQFPICEGIKSGSKDYRMGSIADEFRVVFQIHRDKVEILLVLHELELPT